MPTKQLTCRHCNGTGRELNVGQVDGLLLLPLDWIFDGPFTSCSACDGEGYIIREYSNAN